MLICRGTQLCFTLVLNIGRKQSRHPNRLIMENINNDIRKRTISILKKNKNGLSITEISDRLDMNRRSVTKYIYHLLGEGLIQQRKVGTAKLCYLKVNRGRKKRAR